MKERKIKIRCRKKVNRRRGRCDDRGKEHRGKYNSRKIKMKRMKEKYPLRKDVIIRTTYMQSMTRT